MNVTVLSRNIVEIGIYPTVDPLELFYRLLEPDSVSEIYYRAARCVQDILQCYKELQDIIAILCMDELSDDDKITIKRAQDTETYILVPCG